jgi:shikimate dehydrogenase
MDAAFFAFGVPPDRLDVAIRGLAAAGAFGLSVTIPHKEAAARVCDDLDADATAIGAVNCLSFAKDRIRGHNTDAPGFVDSLLHEGCDPKGRRALLLGAGGAARGVAHGLRAAGAKEVVVLAREPARVTWTRAEPFNEGSLKQRFADTDLLIDSTPTGLTPGGIDQLPPLPFERLPSGAAVVCLVYHREPELLARARERSLKTIDGKGMLVFQGKRAFEIWTGKTPPIDVMFQAIEKR